MYIHKAIIKCQEVKIFRKSALIIKNKKIPTPKKIALYFVIQAKEKARTERYQYM